MRPVKKLFILGAVLFAIGASLKATASAAPADCNQDWRLCKDNAELMNSDNSIVKKANAACKIAADHQNKYGDGTWHWGWSFGKFYRGDDYVKSGVMKVIDDDIMFPSRYGGKVRSNVLCTFDMRTGEVTDVLITEAGSANAKDAAPENSPENAQITAVMIRSGTSCKNTSQKPAFKDILADIAAKTDQDLLAAANKTIDAKIARMGLASWCKAIQKAIPFS